MINLQSVCYFLLSVYYSFTVNLEIGKLQTERKAFRIGLTRSLAHAIRAWNER